MDLRYVDVHTTFTFANENRARKVKHTPLLSVLPILPPTEELQNINYGQIISVARIAKRLKQDELAKMMYVKVADVKAWELNSSVPEHKYREHLCKILDCSFVSHAN